MKWNRPTRDELNRLIDKLGGTGAVCRILSKTRATVTKWRTGKAFIDYANWEHLKGCE